MKTGPIETPSTWKQVPLALAIATSFATIQYGFSYYWSVQVVVFGCVALLFGGPVFIKNASVMLYGIIAFFPFFAGLFAFHVGLGSQGSVLRAGRELLCFLVLLAIGLPEKGANGRKIPRLGFWMAALAILTLTFLQALYLRGWLSVNMLVPENYFSLSGGTILEDIAESAILNGFQDVIRPPAFYSEPSYLGFICVSIYYAAHRWGDLRRNLYLFGLLLSVALLARTASGCIMLSALFFALNVRAIPKRARAFLATGLVAGVVGYALLPYLLRVIASTDYVIESSGYVRIIFPLKVVMRVITTYPLGIPPLFVQPYLEANMGNEAYISLDNGVLNTFIHFGYGGFLIWYLLFRAIKQTSTFCFILMCGLFNGAIFSYDKVAIIGIAIIAHRRERQSLAMPALKRSIRKTLATANLR